MTPTPAPRRRRTDTPLPPAPEPKPSILGEGNVRVSQGLLVLVIMAVCSFAGSSIIHSLTADARQDGVTQEHNESVAKMIGARDREIDSLGARVGRIEQILEAGKNCR